MPKPLVIPVFIPHAGCPHQCAFCNQRAVTTAVQSFRLTERIASAISQYQPNGRKGDRLVQLAFFGGNFLGLPPPIVTSLLDKAMVHAGRGEIDTFRFSTRPDTISLQSLSLISGYPVETIEIGAQSMDDSVLEISSRGHTASATGMAMERLKATPYRTVLQMMVGLPGDTDSVTRDTAERLADLSPDAVRIYPTLVLKDSALAGWYEKGAFQPLKLAAAVNRVKLAAAVFRSRNIPVIRMGLQATSDLDDGAVRIAGPYHPAFGHLVYCAAFLERIEAELSDMEIDSGAQPVIRVHPADISRARGDKNGNIRYLTQRFNLSNLTVQPDPAVGREWIAVNPRPPVYIWSLNGRPFHQAIGPNSSYHGIG